VVTFDFLGWGASDKPAGYPYTAANQTGDLDAVIQHLRLGSVVLVAHDASGPPAIDWALEHPQRVAGLVLLNTYYAPMAGLRPPEAIRLFSTPVVQFGAADPYLNAGVARQFHTLFRRPTCSCCPTPATTCSWTSPQRSPGCSSPTRSADPMTASTDPTARVGFLSLAVATLVLGLAWSSQAEVADAQPAATARKASTWPSAGPTATPLTRPTSMS
jgi:pimeloyl-ACP methyl ester carboxylesterase